MRKTLVLVSHGSDGDSLVAKAKAPGMETEGSVYLGSRGGFEGARGGNVGLG